MYLSPLLSGFPSLSPRTLYLSFTLCLSLSFPLVPLPLVFMTSLKYIAFKMAASVCMWLCCVHLYVYVHVCVCVCKDIGTCFLCSGRRYSLLNTVETLTQAHILKTHTYTHTHTQRHSHTFKFVAHGNTFTSAKANAVADTVGVANLKNYILFMIISKKEIIPKTSQRLCFIAIYGLNDLLLK